MNRPKIKDYFAEKSDIKTVHNEYKNSPHLYRYASYLDRYIDDLEDKLSERLEKTQTSDKDKPKALIIADVSFPLFQDLYGRYVQMDDRFETVHIWSKELAIKNKGRWTPMLISKKKFDQEKQYSWYNGS